MPMKEEGSSRKRRAPEIPKEVFSDRLETLPLDLDETGELEIAFTDEDGTEIEMVSDEQAAGVRTRAQKQVREAEQAIRQAEVQPSGEQQPVPKPVQPQGERQQAVNQPIEIPAPGESRYFDEEIDAGLAKLGSQLSSFMAFNYGGNQDSVEENVFRAMLTMNGDPQDYPESQRLPRAEATKWQEATDSEMASIDKHE
eukprot:2514215-Rhodomonas_salina.1